MAIFDDVRGWFGWDEPEACLKEVRTRLIQLSAANTVLSLLLGIVPTGVTRHNGVGFFATAALALLMIEDIGAVRFLRSASRLTHKPFAGIHRMLSWASPCHAALMAGALLAGTIASIQNFTGAYDILVVYRMYHSLRTFSLPEQD